MKWKKLGQIFDFNKSPLKDSFVSHAQSPQAVVFDDFVRVYFTSRIKDTEKTFLSIPQFVDFSKDFKDIIRYSDKEIIERGKLGCFDEHGIFPFSPCFVDGKFYAYTSGWTRRITVDVDGGIGLAVSNDNGISFTRLGDGPILSASLFEPFLVTDPFVKKFNNLYYMFYIRGVKWSDTNPPERVYKISYATSSDGIDWVKSNKLIIPNIIGDNECQALPTVIEINGIYRMYFCYRQMAGFRTETRKGYKIGYAYSNNLEDWVRDDALGGLTLSSSGFDSEMMCYTNIFMMDKQVYLLYNGNNFGKQGFGLAVLEDAE
jgi:hypothetical protein